MRRLFILATFSLLCAGSAISQTKTDAERQGISGPARSVQIERAKISLTIKLTTQWRVERPSVMSLMLAGTGLSELP